MPRKRDAGKQEIMIAQCLVHGNARRTKKIIVCAREGCQRGLGLTPTLVYQLLLSHMSCKRHHVFPIVGGRKVEHLMVNTEALKITLSDEQIKYLESINPFDTEFPLTLIVSLETLRKNIIHTNFLILQGGGSSPSALLSMSGHIDFKSKPSAIKPAI